MRMLAGRAGGPFSSFPAADRNQRSLTFYRERDLGHGRVAREGATLSLIIGNPEILSAYRYEDRGSRSTRDTARRIAAATVSAYSCISRPSRRLHWGFPPLTSGRLFSRHWADGFKYV